MTHLLGHFCGGVGEITGTMTITDNTTGETFTVNKFSRGFIMAAWDEHDMLNQQRRKLPKRMERIQHGFYDAVQVNDEPIHYDATA